MFESTERRKHGRHYVERLKQQACGYAFGDILGLISIVPLSFGDFDVTTPRAPFACRLCAPRSPDVGQDLWWRR